MIEMMDESQDGKFIGRGIWYGMVSGTILQTCVLFLMIYRTNWNTEASTAGDRIKKWGGRVDPDKNDEETTN
ncbi:unnamed protein product [Camellia sinensis]